MVKCPFIYSIQKDKAKLSGPKKKVNSIVNGLNKIAHQVYNFFTDG